MLWRKKEVLKDSGQRNRENKKDWSCKRKNRQTDIEWKVAEMRSIIFFLDIIISNKPCLKRVKL